MRPFAILCDGESSSGWEEEPSTALEFGLDTLRGIINSHTRGERLGGKLGGVFCNFRRQLAEISSVLEDDVRSNLCSQAPASNVLQNRDRVNNAIDDLGSASKK